MLYIPTLRCALLCTMLVGFTGASRAADAPSPEALERGLAGRWTGALEYRDYQSNRSFKLPLNTSLSTGPDRDGMRKLAIENLRWLDVPERDRVYLSLLAARRDDGVMSVISQSFAERPDDARIETLLAVWRDASRSEDSRRWAKNGLQTARNHCESSGLKALQLKIEKALASAP